MAVLSDVTDMEFATLRDILGMSDSLLSKHLSALGEAGYVRLSKAKANGRQRTWVAATGLGISALQRHLASLNSLTHRSGSADAGLATGKRGPMLQG